MRPIKRRTKNVPLNVATHLPITKGERIHFYQNSIPPCKGIFRCVAQLLYHIFSKNSIPFNTPYRHFLVQIQAWESFTIQRLKVCGTKSVVGFFKKIALKKTYKSVKMLL